MPPLAASPLEVVPVVALLLLLVTAVRHPSGRVEAVVAVLAGAATLATGLLSAGDAEAVVRHLGPVIGFLMTILVVGEVYSRAGVFSQPGATLLLVPFGPPRSWPHCWVSPSAPA